MVDNINSSGFEQIKYDIAEFLINNKDEVNHWINEQTSHLGYCERIFSNYPEMFDELLENARQTKLKELIQNHFSLDSEQISLILDEEFVKITLQI